MLGSYFNFLITRSSLQICDQPTECFDQAKKNCIPQGRESFAE